MGDGVDVKEVEGKCASNQLCIGFTKKDERELHSGFSRKLDCFKKILTEEIKKKSLSNTQVIKLCAIHGILPEEVRDFLESETFEIRLTG